MLKILALMMCFQNGYALVNIERTFKIYEHITKVNKIKNPPTIFILRGDDQPPNGYADLKTNTLIITETLLEILDEDGVASTIGHELTHFKYKHVNYSLQSSKVARKQELLADKLGAELAERAGFNKCNGIKWLTGPGDYNHPSAKQRKRAIGCK